MLLERLTTIFDADSSQFDAAAKRVDAVTEECKGNLRSLYASLLALEARVRQASPYQLPEREKTT